MKSLLEVGFILSAQDKMSTVINSTISRTDTRFKGLQKRMAVMNSMSNRFMVGGMAIVAPLIMMAKSAEKAAIANRSLENVMSQMWKGDKGAIQAAKGMENYASELAVQIGQSGSQIKLIQANLATFQNVSKDYFIKSGLFNRATAAAFDIAALKKTDAIANANLLGKALNDPLNMVKALKKSGTVDTKDIANIQKIAVTRGRYAAQMALMVAIERQYKGQAALNATITDRLTQRINVLKVKIGNGLLPYFEKYGNKLIDLVGKGISFIKTHSNLIKIVAFAGVTLIGMSFAIRTVTTVAKVYIGVSRLFAFMTLLNTKYLLAFKLQYYAFVVAQKIATAAQWLWNAALTANPIGIIIVAIGALVAGVIYAYKHWDWFRKAIDVSWASMKKFGMIIKDYVLGRITALIKGIGLVGSAIGNLFSGNFKQAFKDGIAAVNYIDNPFAVVSSNAPKPRDTKTLSRNVARNKSMSSRTNISAPVTVNINGNADKNDLKVALQQHKNTIIGIIDNNNRNKRRLSYQ